MSYILDALKKSDQQRQRGVAPTLLTAQATVPAPRQPRFFLNSALVGALLCVGIAVGWLRPWQSEQPVHMRGPITAKLTTPASRLVAQAQSPALPELVGEREVQLTQDSTSDVQPALPSAGTAMKQETPPVASDEPHAGVAQAATVPPREAAMALADKQDPIAPADAGQGEKVLALSELPASIQQEIPNISISFHAYSSKPKDRHVMINGAMAGQGDILAPGLSLDEITPDGVILGYKGYRIRRGVR